MLPGWVRTNFGLPNGVLNQSLEAALRRPGGLKRLLSFTVAFFEGSGLDFGRHLDLLGLDWDQFWQTMSAPTMRSN